MSQRFEIQTGKAEYRITHIQTDSRIATCFRIENAELVVNALNRYFQQPLSSAPTRTPQEKAIADCKFGTMDWFCCLQEGHEGPHKSAPLSVDPAPAGSGEAGTSDGYQHDRNSHDVSYFVEALAEASQIVGKQNGLDVKLLGAAHLLNWYAEKASATQSGTSKEIVT